MMVWIGTDILPHEADVRRWLRRMLDPSELEDIVQEAYCRIGTLADVAHIRSGRAYFFATARSLVMERLRRERIVRIETMAEIDDLRVCDESPSAERVLSARRELDRVRTLIEQLPNRCRQIVTMRKIENLSQREVAERMGVPEHTVENDIAKGLKLILRAMAEDDVAAETALKSMGHDQPNRITTQDR